MAVPPTPPTRAELRTAVLAARERFVDGLDTLERARLDACLVTRLLPLLRGTVAGYAAMAVEVDPAATGFDVWPRIATAGEPLTFHRAAAADLERRGAWGIREPRAGAPRVVPDTVLVPLVAADARGNRLGYGKGYYDRTLTGLAATRIGVAWDCQVIDDVPAEAWDAPLDWLVTPTRTIRCDAATFGARGGAR